MYDRLVKDKIVTRLTYCDTKTIFPGSSSAKHTFMLNSIFDPDVTGVGHQPAFRDEWNSLYSTYRVTGCTWQINFTYVRATSFNGHVIGTGTNALEGGVVADSSAYDAQSCQGLIAYEVNDSTSTVDINTGDNNILREVGNNKPHVKWKYLSGPFSHRTLRGNTSMRRVLDDPQKAQVSQPLTSNATHPVYLHVGALTKDGNPMADVRFDIKLVMTVVMSDPANVNES